ncbi:MAG TPA: PilZ domain-containing protein [Candidatus Eremiobacteraceae bacterium]|nr:PilZ domain-containing protein [Candidatus Eremiobacteraceae bacterium]
MSLIDSIVNVFSRRRRSGRRGTPRRSARLMVSHPVRVRATRTFTDQPALLEDLSSGGACVRSASRMRAGENVVLNVHLSTNVRFEQLATVVYVQRQQSGYQSRYGLRFVELRPDVKMSIVKYVAEEQYGRKFGVHPFSNSAGPI